jgi:hypothetical protein
VLFCMGFILSLKYINVKRGERTSLDIFFKRRSDVSVGWVGVYFFKETTTTTGTKQTGVDILCEAILNNIRKNQNDD